MENLRAVDLPKGRKGDHAAAATAGEARQFATLVYQLNWVAKESRPEVAGAASLLSSRVRAPTIGDILEANRAARMLRSTASQKIIIWKLDLADLQFVLASDCSGAGTADEERAQAAWLVMAASRRLSEGVTTKASLLSWRSSRLRRVVASTLAGETLSLTQGVAELEWMQTLFRDVVFNDVVAKGWDQRVHPYTIALTSQCDIAGRQGSLAVIDAKSVFDTLLKQTAGSKQDRRTAVDLALLLQSFQQAGTAVRWIPRPRMPADIMTKSDVSRGNEALTELLRHSRRRLLDDETDIGELRGGKPMPGRSTAASRRELRESRLS